MVYLQGTEVNIWDLVFADPLGIEGRKVNVLGTNGCHQVFSSTHFAPRIEKREEKKIEKTRMLQEECYVHVFFWSFYFVVETKQNIFVVPITWWVILRISDG